MEKYEHAIPGMRFPDVARRAGGCPSRDLHPVAPACYLHFVASPVFIAGLLLSCGVALAGQSPACRVISGRAGGPAIVIDGQTYSPIFFAGNNQFGRDENLLEEVRQAAQVGIDLISFNVSLDWDGPKEDTAKIIDAFCSANPDAYYYVRMWLGGTAKWLKEHPESCIVKGGGEPVLWASSASTVWRAEAERLLRGRIAEITNGPHGDRFIGVCLTNMQTGEWFYYHANETLDYSTANLDAFRVWLKAEYQTDRRLQKAWGDPAVTLKSASLPGPELCEAAVLGPFRDPVAQRPAMDAQRFQSQLVADTVAYFAHVVKESTYGRALAGAFYGYTMELNHNGPRVLAQSGHLALARLLECPDIDLIHAPYAYFERHLGQPGHFHLPVDSVALYGKLAVLEEDTYTHQAIDPPAGLIAPGGPDRTKTLVETLAIDRRNFGNFFSHKCGFWYFDLLSDGRWGGKEFWETAALTRRMAATMRDEPVFQPEVAFVLDEDSVHYLRATTHPYLLQSLGFWRSEVARLGTTVGYYLQSDVDRIPDSVKVVILANPYAVDHEELRALTRMLGRGRTVIWTFAPGLYGPDGLDVSRIAKLTGMTVDPLKVEGPLTVVSEITGETVDLDPWQPRFEVTGGYGQVLAKYEGTHHIAVAAKPEGKGVSVYTAVPRLPVGMLKWIGRNSGVHFYRDSPGMVGVIGPYLVAHAGQETAEQFHWPVELGSVERLVPFSAQPVAAQTDTWSDTLPAGATVIYRCTP